MTDEDKLPPAPVPMFSPEVAEGGKPATGPMRQSNVKLASETQAKGASKPQQPAVKAPKPADEKKAEADTSGREAFLVNIPGSELLTDDEIAEIRARSKRKAQEDMKARAMKAAEDQFDKLERQALDPDEELELVQVDVPGFAAINKNGTGIMIDGVIYQHGMTYTLPRRQAQSLKDIMAQAWSHEDETGGASRDTYRRPRNQIITPRDAGMNTSNLMRV